MTADELIEPPKNINAERTVLGACLIDNARIETVAGVLRSSDFYPQAHQEIFKAIIELSSLDVDVDLISVSALLEKNNKLELVGGRAALAEFEQHVLTTGEKNIRAYALKVKHAAQRRETIKAAHETINLAQDAEKPLSTLFDHLQKTVDKGRAESAAGLAYHPDSDPWVIGTTREALEERPPREFIFEAPNIGLFPIPSVCMIVGDAGSHKTNLCIEWLICAASGEQTLVAEPSCHSGYVSFRTRQTPSLYLNFDMPTDDLKDRFAAFIRGRRLHSTEFPFYFYSYPYPHLDPTDENAMIALGDRLLHRKIQFLIIDNLQLIRGALDENSSEMGAIIMAFKRMAERCRAVVGFIHHNKKDGDYRGSSALIDLVDYSLKIVRSEDDRKKVMISPGKERGAPIERFAAEFTFEHKPGTKELEEARFWSIPAKMDGAMLEEMILEVVQHNAHIASSKLVEEVRDDLPDVSRTIVRRKIKDMVKTKRLIQADGIRNSKTFSSPG